MADPDVWEAAIRYNVDGRRPTTRPDFDFYFVSIDGRDPPPALLARFAAEPIPVLPRSIATDDLRYGVRHRTLGGHGLMISFDGDVTRVDADTADLSVWCSAGARTGTRFTYHVVRRDGRWSVTKTTVTAIT